MSKVNLEGLEPLEVLEELSEAIKILLANDPEYFDHKQACNGMFMASTLQTVFNHARWNAAKREGVAIGA